MDPITMIVTALVAGAVAAGKDVAAQAVQDGYAGLKALIVRKFGEKGNVASALAGVEKKPDSETWQAGLKEELETAGAAQDAVVMTQARALLDLLKEHGPTPGASYHAELRGSGAIAQGEGAVAAGAGGVAAGGNVHGGVHVSGKQTDDAEEEKK
jgi:predicted phosphoribosyltransferase